MFSWRGKAGLVQFLLVKGRGHIQHICGQTHCCMTAGKTPGFGFLGIIVVSLSQGCDQDSMGKHSVWQVVKVTAAAFTVVAVIIHPVFDQPHHRGTGVSFLVAVGE